MTPINQIIISGFRGVLTPLRLSFVKGQTPRSMVIYGRNGTGKSSITDAWEWFHTEKIMHLAREGAGPSSYPHINALDGETFVEVSFASEQLGSMCLDFDRSRITMPVATGDVAHFRTLVPHPCHISFADLTRFVYLTKADKYDALAQLMGFTPQVEFQKALKRVLRSLSDSLDDVRRDVNQVESNLSSLLKLPAISEQSVLKCLNEILKRYNLEPSDLIGELIPASKILTEMVEKDPRSQELADLRAVKKVVQSTQFPVDLCKRLQLYAKLVQGFKLEEKSIVDLLLIGLYEQGETVLTHRKELGLEIQHCPLCGKWFEGDLLDHISKELSKLQELKRSRDALEKRRQQAQKLLSPLVKLSEPLREIVQDVGAIAEKLSTEAVVACQDELEETLLKFKSVLRLKPESISVEVISSMQTDLSALHSQVEELDTTQTALLGQLSNQIKELEQDTGRRQLVTDHTKLLSALGLWKQWKDANERMTCTEKVHASFETIVDDYIQSSIDDVQNRFEVVSSDLQTCFDILEESAEGLGKPILKLLTDQDRAVVLQVEFRGKSVYPAYRYLSESQLNSFGLAVFLASAKHFNPNFRFLLLDDVINSFDAYKRPQVIKLLKQEFSDFQVLLLTHDSVWYDRLIESCPDWIRHRFTRLEPGSGPIVMGGCLPLEEIEQLLDEDKPVQAGRNMGPFLERQLQELCEFFGVFTKYNRRNEYTLDPLLDRFRVRVREKLGKGHDLYKAVVDLQKESGFRNLCAHWKDPEIQISLEEMRLVTEKWNSVSDLVRCDKCHIFLQYDGRRRFVCSMCGETCLEKV